MSSSEFVVEAFPLVDAFVLATEEFRSTEPVLTNVIGSIAAGVHAGRVYDTMLFLAIRDAHGRVVGCGAATSPWNLSVSPMPLDAARALGRYLVETDTRLPGITGVRAVVDAVVEAMNLGYQPRVAMHDVIRVLGELVPPPKPAPGSPRRADDADRDLLISWLNQFGIDAGLPMHDVPAAVHARLQARAFWFWEVDGQPVALTGHAPMVPTSIGNVGRIGPVYTPAEHRGHGYAAAVTTVVVRALQPECAVILLYADATNPTSNAVYERLGFRTVAEVLELEFAGAPDDFDNHFH